MCEYSLFCNSSCAQCPASPLGFITSGPFSPKFWSSPARSAGAGRVCRTEKQPSASTNPLNHPSSFRGLRLIGNLAIFVLWFLFNQSIKLYNLCIFGVLNLPFINLTILFNPITDDIIRTQALFFNLYLIYPDPMNSNNFLANGSSLIWNVIQNLGLCFFLSVNFCIHIWPSPSNKPAK